SPAVLSTADDWLFNFPTLTGETRTIDRSEWAPYPITADEDEYQHAFMRWLLNHLPRAAGRHLESGRRMLSDWWQYLVRFDLYDESHYRSDMAPPQPATSTPTATATPTSTPTDTPT